MNSVGRDRAMGLGVGRVPGDVGVPSAAGIGAAATVRGVAKVPIVATTRAAATARRGHRALFPALVLAAGQPDLAARAPATRHPGHPAGTMCDPPRQRCADRWHPHSPRRRGWASARCRWPCRDAPSASNVHPVPQAACRAACARPPPARDAPPRHRNARPRIDSARGLGWGAPVGLARVPWEPGARSLAARALLAAQSPSTPTGCASPAGSWRVEVWRLAARLRRTGLRVLHQPLG